MSMQRERATSKSGIGVPALLCLALSLAVPFVLKYFAR
jgi:hypothetical protein